MIYVYFLRHFPTKSNITNSWCGAGSNLDIDLSKANQCLEGLNELKNIDFDYIFISPLKRCKQTYDLLNLKTKFIIDPRLIERDFGSLEQKPCTEADKLALADFDKNLDLDCGVEKIQSMYFNKVIPFINDLRKAPQGSKILIIAHSWIGRLFKYYFTNKKSEISIAPKNGQILKFELK